MFGIGLILAAVFAGLIYQQASRAWSSDLAVLLALPSILFGLGGGLAPSMLVGAGAVPKNFALYGPWLIWVVGLAYAAVVYPKARRRALERFLEEEEAED